MTTYNGLSEFNIFGLDGMFCLTSDILERVLERIKNSINSVLCLLKKISPPAMRLFQYMLQSHRLNTISKPLPLLVFGNNSKT